MEDTQGIMMEWYVATASALAELMFWFAVSAFALVVIICLVFSKGDERDWH